MKTIEILGENCFDSPKRTIEGCRGVMIRGGMILLSYEENTDQYMLPGGGIEDNEDLESCCIREFAEEVGIRVKPHTHYLTLEEYYKDLFFKSHYFVCGYDGECSRMLTEQEKANGLVPVWIELKKAIEIFGCYKDYKENNPMKYGLYYREHLALCEFLNWAEENK